MNITDEIGRKIKTLFAYFILQTNVIDFMVLFTCIPTGGGRIFPLITNGMAKEKRKGENCLGML